MAARLNKSINMINLHREAGITHHAEHSSGDGELLERDKRLWRSRGTRSRLTEQTGVTVLEEDADDK
jgi:hypothetical protein